MSRTKRIARMRERFSFAGPAWLVNLLNAALTSTLESDGRYHDSDSDEFRDAFLFDLLLGICDRDELDAEVVGAFAPTTIADQLAFKLQPVNGIEQSRTVIELRAALSAFVAAEA